MPQTPVPQPLTRTNITKHDRIWDKSISDGFYGHNINKCCLFSPPLKHITPERTEELWEEFDPLDLLFDSASDRSDQTTSTNDTMIMMTTEEERKNEESIKNSFLVYQLQKSVKNNPQYSQHYAPRSERYGHDCDSYELHIDEGYGTDSRTTTTASLASPLSSSLSSLLTSESSSSQGSLKRNSAAPNMTSNPKPQQIQSNGRLIVGNKANMTAKKKIQPVEKADNSFMERLRALTTIEEEESLLSNMEAERADSLKSAALTEDLRFSDDGHQVSSVSVGSGQSIREGVFRARPIILSEHTNRLDTNIVHNNADYWSNNSTDAIYTNCDHSSKRDGPDQTRGHLMQADLGPRPSHMISMPNLRSSEHYASHHMVNGFDDSRVKMRPKPPDRDVHRQQQASRYSWDCSDTNNIHGKSSRYSWDCNDANNIHGKFNALDNKNLSENIPEAPKLSNQIWASSEMSLRTGRPLFAASSDIYKLFQSHGGQQGYPRVKPSSHRHSFHAMPSQNWQQPVDDTKSRCRVSSFSNPAVRPNAPGSVKASHTIYNNFNGAAGSIGNSTAYQKNTSLVDNDKLSTLV